MTFWRTLLPALLICPSLTFAASKEIVELQRDLALLQEQVRSMQRSQDEKFSAIQVLVQQALDSANKTSTSVALLQNNLQQSFKDQQKSVVDPVVGVGAKIDQMTTDVSAMRDRSGGKDDLALQGFGDYLKYYGDSTLAPNAQFYIAEMHAKQNKLDNDI